MILTHWLGMIQERLGRSRRRRVRSSQRPVVARRRAGAKPSTPEWLESRVALVADWGDAPDTGAGTGPGNYQTLSSDGGPSHVISGSLYLGNSVDSEADGQPNAAANGDDTTTQDDEDGVANPLSDLVLTIGAQPTVTLNVTGPVGPNLTLYGWVDYNNNGVFDAAEGTSSAFTLGGTTGRVTLTLPTVPAGYVGTTYARFRLSTDVGLGPTGPASDGEVEDYQVTISSPAQGVANSAGTVKIASATNGGPTLADFDVFGAAIAPLGDLDNDGVEDIVVGAPGDDTGGFARGAIYVQLLNADGSVKTNTKIASGVNGGPTLADGEFFGSSVANLGDLDGDGVTDLAVGAYLDDTGGTNRGALYILFLNSDGTVKGSTKIANGTGGGPTLGDGDIFGTSVAGIGDLDGDGLVDVVVGAPGDDTGGSNRGAVYVLTLNADGTVKASTKIANATGGGPALANGEYFGRSVANIGDLDGDGVLELAVGSPYSAVGGSNRGRVHILFLTSNGTAASTASIASGVGGGPTLEDGDYFGFSVAGAGDLNGDGLNDLLVGAKGDGSSAYQFGAVHALLLNPDGTVRQTSKITDGLNGGPTLTDGDFFGYSMAVIGDVTGDGIVDIAVGASQDDTGGTNRGSVYFLPLTPAPPPPQPLQAAELVSRVPATLVSTTGSGPSNLAGPFNTFSDTFPNSGQYRVASADGRYVVFSSAASNLVDGLSDLNQADDVYLRDTVSGVTTLVSHAIGNPLRSSGGISGEAQISSDGRYVVFASDSRNLVSGLTYNNSGNNLFAWDRLTGTTTLVTHTNANPLATPTGGYRSSFLSGQSFLLADDGAGNVWVGFTSESNDIASSDPDAFADVFVSAIAGTHVGTYALVSRTAAGTPANSDSELAALAVDGSGSAIVVFSTDATNVLAAVTDTNGRRDLYVYDVVADAMELVTRDGTDPNLAAGNVIFTGPPQTVSISGDGNRILFSDTSTTLVSGSTDANGVSDLFLRDLSAGTTTLVSHAAGTPLVAANGLTQQGRISRDGNFIAYTTRATNVVAGVTDTSSGLGDVYRYSIASGTSQLVSYNNANTTETASDNQIYGFGTHFLAISDDGGEVVYSATAHTTSNLYASFLSSGEFSITGAHWSSSTGLNTLVTRKARGDSFAQPLDDNLTTFVRGLSADGATVYYETKAIDNRTAPEFDHNILADVFAFDTGAASDPTLISARAPVSGNVGANLGVSFTGTSSSSDGRYVVFTSESTDLVVTGAGQSRSPRSMTTQVYLRDRQTGLTTLVTASAATGFAANGSSFFPRISGNGRYVVYETQATDIVAGVSDTNGAVDIIRYDRVTGQSIFVSRADGGTSSSNGNSGNAHISEDGDVIAFTSDATNLVSGYSGSSTQVFAYRVSTDSMRLVSHTTGSGTTAGNDQASFYTFVSGAFRSPLSADGTKLAFISSATNLVTGQDDTNLFSDAFYADLSPTVPVVTLVSRVQSTAAQTGNGGVDVVWISGDGTRVVLLSTASNFITGQIDNNADRDVFVYTAGMDAAGVQGLTLVSKSEVTGETVSGFSDAPAISHDGRFVVFITNATDYKSGVVDTNAAMDVYLYDLNSNTRTLLSRSDAAGLSTANAASYEPSMSGNPANGTIVFSSDASNVFTTAPSVDTNLLTDVFAYETVSTGGGGAVFRLISRDAGTSTAPSHFFGSGSAIVSADGRSILFVSDAPGIVGGDFNGQSDLFAQSVPLGPTAPTDITLSNNIIVENLPAGTAIGTLTAVDPNITDVHTFQVLNVAPRGILVGIVGNTLVTRQPLDFEAVASFDVTVRATDSFGLTFNKTFTINVTDVNDPPTDITLTGGLGFDLVDGLSLVGTGVRTISETDPDDVLASTYTLVAGAGDTDNFRFDVVGEQLSFTGDVNYELQPSYTIRLRATDASGAFFEKAFTLRVQDTHEQGVSLITSVGGTDENPNFSHSANRASFLADSRGGRTISTDGRYVLFSSEGRNVVAGMTLAAPTVESNLFQFDKVTGEVTLISHTAGSLLKGGGYSGRTAMSADGRFVAYTSFFTLHEGIPSGGVYANLYLWDRNTGENRLISHAFGSPNTPANRSIPAPGTGDLYISDDGRFIAFEDGGDNLVDGQVNLGNVSNVFLYDRLSDSIRLVSHGSGTPSTALSEGAKVEAISGDGSTVAFSTFGEVISGFNNISLFAADLYTFDVLTGQRRLVNHQPGDPLTTSFEGHLPSFYPPTFSFDGKRLLSKNGSTNLVAGQTAGDSEAWYVYESEGDENFLVTRSDADPLQPIGADFARISRDGRFVVFTSRNSGFTATDGGTTGDSLTDRDVYRHELLTGEVKLVSHQSGDTTVPSNYAEEAASISDDGRFVLFTIKPETGRASFVNGAVTEDFPVFNAFLYDFDTNVPTLVSHRGNAVNTTANSSALTSELSGDGSYVAWEFQGSGGVNGNAYTDNTIRDFNRVTDVVLFARSDASNVLVSKSGEPARTAMNEDGFGHLLRQQISTSDDGRYVAFASRATNIGGGIGYDDANGTNAYDVFLHDRQTNITLLVSHSSVALGTAANGNSFHPVISGDGRFIAYLSNATNLDGAVTTANTLYDVYLYDRDTNTNKLVSRASLTAEGDLGLNLGNDPDFLVSTFYGEPQLRNSLTISRDGTYIAFASRATDLVSGFTDNNGNGTVGGLGNITGGTDLFVYEVDTGTIRLASGAAGSTTSGGDGASYRPSMSDDGKRVAFLSESTDLISGGTIFNVQAYVYDWTAGTTTLVSHAAGSTTTSGDRSVQHAVISGGGGHVAFMSSSSDHVSGQSDSFDTVDVFLYYVDADGVAGGAAGEIRLASATAASSTTAGGTSTFAFVYEQLGVSADGRFVAFLSAADDLTSGVTYPGGSVLRLFRRDFVDPGTLLISHVAGDLTTAVSAGDTVQFAMDASGNGIAFISQSTELVLGGTYLATENAYFWSRADDLASALGSRLVSKLPDAQTVTTGEEPAQSVFIDRLAMTAFFTSHAAGLVRGDFNERGDLFALELNTPPTTIGLSNTFIIDGSPSGSRIGFLATNDPGDTHTYTLEAGAGDADNAKFSISGNSLFLNETPDLGTQNLYFVRVRVTDSAGQTFESQFVIEVVASRSLPIIGTSGNDSLDIFFEGDSIRYTLNGTPFLEIPVASVSDFNVDLGAGDDTVSFLFTAAPGYDFSRPAVLSGVENVLVFNGNGIDDVITAREQTGSVVLERSVVGVNVDRAFAFWMPDTSASLQFQALNPADVDQLTIHAGVAPFFPANTTTATGFDKYLFVGTAAADQFNADFSSTFIDISAPLVGVDVLRIASLTGINDIEFRGGAGDDTLVATVLSGSTYTGTVTVLGEGANDTLVLGLAEDVTPQFIVFSTENLTVNGDSTSLDEFYRLNGTTGTGNSVTLERALSFGAPAFTNVIGFWEVQSGTFLTLNGGSGVERLEYGVANTNAVQFTTTASVQELTYLGTYDGSTNRTVFVDINNVGISDLNHSTEFLRIVRSTFTGELALGQAAQTVLEVDATVGFFSDVRVLAMVTGDVFAVDVVGGATVSTTVPPSTSNANPATYVIDGAGVGSALFNLIVPGRVNPGGAVSFTGLDGFALNLGGDTTTVDVSTPNTTTLQIDPVNSGQLIQLASTTLVNILGTTANETLTVDASAAPVGGLNFGTIDLGGGTDSATATGGTVNAASILNVESVSGFSAGQYTITGTSGNDVFTASLASNILTVTNTTTSETFNIDVTVFTSVRIDGGTGTDSFTFTAGDAPGIPFDLIAIESLTVSGGTVTLQGSASYSFTDLTVSAGTLVLSADTTVTSQFTQSGGTITRDANLTVDTTAANSFQWTGGAQNGTGQTRFTGTGATGTIKGTVAMTAGSLRIEATMTLGDDGVTTTEFTNRGTVFVPGLFVLKGGSIFEGTISVLPGGELRQDSTATTHINNGAGAPGFINSDGGLIRAAQGQLDVFNMNGGALNNATLQSDAGATLSLQLGGSKTFFVTGGVTFTGGGVIGTHSITWLGTGDLLFDFSGTGSFGAVVSNFAMSPSNHIIVREGLVDISYSVVVDMPVTVEAGGTLKSLVEIGYPVDFHHAINVQSSGKLAVGGTGPVGFQMNLADVVLNAGATLEALNPTDGVVRVNSIDVTGATLLFSNASIPSGAVASFLKAPSSGAITGQFANASFGTPFNQTGRFFVLDAALDGTVSLTSLTDYIIQGSSGNDVFTATRFSTQVQITNTTTSETFTFDPLLYTGIRVSGLGGDDTFTLDLSMGGTLGSLVTLDTIETINVIGTAVTDEIFTISDFANIPGAIDVGYAQTISPPSAPQIRVLTGPMRTFNITASGGNDRVVVSATSTTTDRVLVTSTGAESVQVGSQFGSSIDRTLELTGNTAVWRDTVDGGILYSTTQATDIGDLRVGGGNTRILISDDAQFNQIVGVSSLLTSDTVVVMPPTGTLPSASVQWFPSRFNTQVSVPTTGGGGTPIRISVASDIDYVDLNGFTNVLVDWSASLAASTVTIDAANGESRVTSPDFGPKILFTGSNLSLLGNSFSDIVTVDSTAASVPFGSVDVGGGADRFEVFGAGATVASLSGVEDLHVTGSSAGLTLSSSPPVERLSVDGGRFTLNGPLTVTTAFQQLGTTSVIDGTEVLTVTGDFDWQAGRQGGSGRTTVAPGAGTTASIGTVTLGDTRILELNGRSLDIGDGTTPVTATLESGAMFRGNGSWRVKSNAVVTGTGTWEVPNLAEIVGFHVSGAAARVEVPVAVFGGTIRTQGLLDIVGGGTLIDATVTTDPATQILLDGQFTVGGLGLTLQGGGSIVAASTSMFGSLTGSPFITVNVTGANAYVELAGTNNLSGSHVVNSGTLYLAGVTAGDWTVQSGGRLIGNRLSQANASAPSIIGNLIVNAGGVLVPTKAGFHFSNPVFTVGSLLMVPGSILRIEDGTNSGIGSIRLASLVGTILVDQATLEIDPFQLRVAVDYPILEDLSDPRNLSVSFSNVPVGPVFIQSGVAYRLTESPVGSVVTFRRMPPLSDVTVDASFTGLPDGTDPDGAGPLQAIGYDAFATITGALNAVSDFGTIRIAAGTYTEALTLTKSVILMGADPLNPFATTIDAAGEIGISSFTPGAVLQFNNLAVTNASQPLFVAGANFLAVQNSVLAGSAPSVVDVPFVSISLVPGRNVGIVEVSPTRVFSGDTGVIQLGSTGNLEVFADGGSQAFRVVPSAGGTNITVRTSGSTNGRDFLFVDLTGLPVPEYRDIGGEQGELNFGSTPTFFYNGFSTIDFLPPVTLSEAEPNNDAGTSQLVPLAAVSPQTAVIGDLSTGTDVDRFQVIVAADRTLRVVVTSTGSGPQASLLQPRLGLFDAAGTLLQSVDATFVNGQWTAMLSRFTGVTATFIVAVTDFGDVNFDGTQGTGDGIAADSGNYSLRLESVVEAFVHPQPTATLSTGTGDGAVNVLVSASGVFEGADYDPIGAIALNSTTFLSDVAVRILGAVPQVFFLSQAARNAVLTVTPDGVSSTFDAGPLRFTLFQSVLPVFDGLGVRSGSQLVQTYTIVNLLNTPVDYELVRYFDGDLEFDSSISDGGGRIVQGNTEYLFETDAGGSGAMDTTFVGITAQGGETAVAGRYQITDFLTLRSLIGSGTTLSNSIFGDNNADEFIDAGMEYDLALALRDLYTGVGANQSRVWTTRTFFGSGAPVDSINQVPDLPPIADRTFLEDALIDEIVPVSDLETPLDSLVFDLSSTNPALFPVDSVQAVFRGGAWHLVGSPAPNQSGTASVTVRVTDAAGATSSVTFLVTVLPVNDAPVLAPLSDVTRFPGNGVTTLSLPVDASDIEQSPDTLQLSVTTDNPALFIPGGLRIVAAAPGESLGTLTIVQAAGATGTATITVTAMDTEGLFVTRSFVLTVLAPPTGEIVGSVFHDRGEDGLRDAPLGGDAGDPGLTGIQVYVDANNNGLQDAGEALVSTDANGNFRFTGVALGSYLVRVLPGAGFSQTAPLANAGVSVIVTNDVPGNAVFGLTDDHGGLTGTGTDVALTAGEIVEFAGSIQTTSDVDLFRVVAPENGLLDVGVIADFDLDSELDVVARLYRIDGATRVLIDEDSVGGVIRTRLLQAAVQAGQVFEIEVTGFSGSLGAYTALVGSTPNTVDDFGDTFSSAPTIVIPPNTPTTQQGRVETGMDVDFFRFVPSTSGLLQASVTGTFTKTAGLVLYGSDRRILQLGDPATGVLSSNVIAGNTYFLAVVGPDGLVGSYSFSVNVLANDTGSDFGGATTVGLNVGNSIEAIGTIAAVGELDFYEFVSPVTGRGVVTLEDRDGVVDSTLDAFLIAYRVDDGTPVQIALNDDVASGNLDSRVTFDLIAGKTYFIRASGFGSSIGDYLLRGVLTPADDVGDIVADAKPFLVGPGAPATLAGTLTTTDVDVFRFTATITGTTAVNLTRTGGPNQPLDLRIIDGDLQEIRRGTQSGTAELVRTFDTIAGRTYYIRVARSSELDTTAQTYRIDVSQIEAIIVEDTPLLDDRAQRSLQRDVDESVSEGIAETTSFRTGEQSGTKTADARINEILLEKFLNYFGGIEAFSEPVLFIWFDPIDFVVTDPGSREVGFTDARGTVNQVGKGVSYSGNGATEWLVVPAAQAGSYALQLVGVGSSQYRFGANFISSSGVQSITSTGTLLKGDATVVLDFSRKGTGEGGGGGGGGGGGRGGGGFAGIAQDVAAVLRPGTTLAFGGSGGGGGGGGGGRGAIGGDGLFSVSDTPGGGGMGAQGQAKGVGGSGGGSGSGGLFRAVARSLSEPFTAITGRRGMPSLSPASQKALANFWSTMGRRLVSLPSLPVQNVPSFEDVIDWLQQPTDNASEEKAADAPANPAPQNGEAPVRKAEVPSTDGKTTAVPRKGADEAWQRAGADVRERLRRIAEASRREAARLRGAKVRVDAADRSEKTALARAEVNRRLRAAAKAESARVETATAE